MVEILHKGTRVASHARSYARHRHTTTREHMPERAPALRRLDAGADDA
jgi:hypothetical protein